MCLRRPCNVQSAHGVGRARSSAVGSRHQVGCWRVPLARRAPRCRRSKLVCMCLSSTGAYRSVNGYLLRMADHDGHRRDLAAMLHPLMRALVAAELPVLAGHGISMWGYVVLTRWTAARRAPRPRWRRRSEPTRPGSSPPWTSFSRPGSSPVSRPRRPPRPAAGDHRGRAPGPRGGAGRYPGQRGPGARQALARRPAGFPARGKALSALPPEEITGA